MKRHIAFALFLFLLISSCKKDHSTLLTIQEFPTSVGSWWKYQRFNASNKLIDTSTYTILDTQVINNTTYQRWVITLTGLNAPYTDTMLIQVLASSIIFSPIMNIKFPVIDNETWCSTQPGISYNATVQNVTVNNVSYNGVTCLSKYAPYIGGTSTNESYWIVKNIGFVEELINDDGAGYLHLNLISYHIN